MSSLPQFPANLVRLGVTPDMLTSFCHQHRIVWLAIFGSVLREDFAAHSDVDVLVEFAPGVTHGLAFFTIQDELAALLGRPIDMALPSEISHWIRDEVLGEAQVLYDAA